MAPTDMIYQYACKNGHQFERVLPVADYRTPQKCECGADGRRVISIPRLVTATPDVRYDSPIDGRAITSMAKRRDDMARNNCREYDPEMKTDAARFRKDAEVKFERRLEDDVERSIDAMPQRKREQLDNELKSGADINIVRRSV